MLSLRTTWGTPARVHRVPCSPCRNARKVSLVATSAWRVNGAGKGLLKQSRAVAARGVPAPFSQPHWTKLNIISPLYHEIYRGIGGIRSTSTTKAGIRELLGMSGRQPQLDAILSRMVATGDVVRTERGIYALPAG